MDQLLVVMTWISVAMIVVVMFSVRGAHIRVEYSVSWLATGVGLLVLSRWSWGVHKLADMLGIASAPLALAIVVSCVFLAFFYRFSVIISGLKDANIALTQKLAILEYQVRSLHEEQESAGRA